MCLLFLVLLVVILRVDMLRLTLRVVADLCCDVFARCCALFGLARCCGNRALNVVVWCCCTLFKCCLLLFVVDAVVCCVLIIGAVRWCVMLVVVVVDVVVCCLLVSSDVRCCVLGVVVSCFWRYRLRRVSACWLLYAECCCVMWVVVCV